MKPSALAVSVVGAGLVSLLAGLVHLQWVFGEEREERLAAIAVQQRAAAELGRREVLEVLAAERKAANARIDAAGKDPIARPADLLLEVRGDHLLPPPATAEGKGRLHALLSLPAEDTPPLDDNVEQERWRLLHAARTAATADQARPAFAQLLRHLADHRLDPAFDVATTLLALEALEARSPPPSDAVVQQLLLSGIGYEHAEDVGLPPLLGRISRDRDRLDAEGLALLLPRLEAVAEQHRVALQPLVDDLGQPPSTPPALAGPPPPEGALVSAEEQTWLVWPQGWGETRGCRLDKASLTAAVANSLAQQTLLPGDALLVLDDGALHGLTVALSSSAWDQAAALAERRYQQKTALALACALLAFVAMGLAGLMVRRRQQLLELRSDFVATVSHELRTPLSAIRLLGETLERKLKDEPRARDYPAQIVRQVDRLGFLVDNLLSFNRVDKGRWDLRLETVDLHALAAEISNEVQGQMPGAVVVNDVPPGTEVVADAELMRLLLGNLTRNGLTYTKATTPIVTLAATGPRTLEVRDNGVGVADEDKERIFEPFARARAPRVNKKGSGLGLGLCRRIVRLHQGDLRLAQTGPQGSTFEVVLGQLGDDVDAG